MLLTSFSLQTRRCSQLRHDRVYVPVATMKRDIVADRQLRTRSTFSKSVMVSVAVSKLGCTGLIFIEPGVKVNGQYYRDLLSDQLLPAIRHIALQATFTHFSRTALRRTVHVKPLSCCNTRPQTSSLHTYGLLTVQTLILLITGYGSTAGTCLSEICLKC